MRLVCPKCAVQYEVGEDAIPADGRDVQCSACGHGWFQQHPATPPQQTLVADLTPPAVMQGTAAPPASPPRKPLDEKVMAILREEALREAAVRRTELARADVPPPPPPAEPAHAGPEVTLVQPAPMLPAMPEYPHPVARRELLPDIEEINSTLAAGSRRRGPVTPQPEDPRPGFRAGFGLMMVLVAWRLAPMFWRRAFRRQFRRPRMQ